jgi:HEAT repeat protein
LRLAVEEIQQLILQLMSGDDEQAEAAVEGLTRHGAFALPRLADLLNSQDADNRWWAVRALAAVDSPDVSPLLIEAMQDASPPVRQVAALGMRFHPNSEAVPVLTQALADRDRLTAHLASDALAACGEDAVESLGQALHSSLSSVRVEAARALAGMGEPAVISLLFHALDDDSATVNFWAERGLECLGIGMVFFNP